MPYIQIEFPFADTMATVGGYYSPYLPGRWYLSNGDPGFPEELSELEVDKFIVEGEDIFSELSRMYVATGKGEFELYIDTINSELCAKADEEYMNDREECYAGYD